MTVRPPRTFALGYQVFGGSRREYGQTGRLVTTQLGAMTKPLSMRDLRAGGRYLIPTTRRRYRLETSTTNVPGTTLGRG